MREILLRMIRCDYQIAHTYDALGMYEVTFESGDGVLKYTGRVNEMLEEKYFTKWFTIEQVDNLFKGKQQKDKEPTGCESVTDKNVIAWMSKEWLSLTIEERSSKNRRGHVLLMCPKVVYAYCSSTGQELEDATFLGVKVQKVKCDGNCGMKVRLGRP